MMIYLASQSPRRRELLAQIGVQFQTLSVDVDETPIPSESPQTLVERLALSKAQAGFHAQGNKGVVLGSDTIVVCKDEVLGKPKDKSDSIRMLSKLSDSTHQVMTAVAVASDKEKKVITQTSNVTFRELTQEEMVNYWATGEPCDKAGSYGIQGIGALFISHLEGSYSGVMGLPVYETAQLLNEFDISHALHEREMSKK